jgi:hypothetical protein
MDKLNNIVATFSPNQAPPPPRAICSYYNNTAPLKVTLSLSGMNESSYYIYDESRGGGIWNLSVGPVDPTPSFSIKDRFNDSYSLAAMIETDVSGKLYYAFRDLSDISEPVNPLDFE